MHAAYWKISWDVCTIITCIRALTSRAVNNLSRTRPNLTRWPGRWLRQGVPLYCITSILYYVLFIYARDRRYIIGRPSPLGWGYTEHGRSTVNRPGRVPRVQFARPGRRTWPAATEPVPSTGRSRPCVMSKTILRDFNPFRTRFTVILRFIITTHVRAHNTLAVVC